MLTETVEWDELDLEAQEDEDDKYMPTFEHGVLGNRIGFLIRRFIEGKNLGEVADSTVEYRFLQRPENSKRKPYRQPDVSFISRERMPKSYASYPENAPDLAVEIISPSDRTTENEAKVKLYQKAGVKIVWLVHPYSRRIEVYRIENGLRLQNVFEGDEIDADGVIPGLKLAVSEIFGYPPAPDDDTAD